jgi:hypothetical protein
MTTAGALAALPWVVTFARECLHDWSVEGDYDGPYYGDAVGRASDRSVVAFVAANYGGGGSALESDAYYSYAVARDPESLAVELHAYANGLEAGGRPVEARALRDRARVMLADA